jgi:DNA ligase-4
MDLSFTLLCDTLDALSTKNTAAKKHVIKGLIDGFRSKNNGDVFPLMRILLPHLDTERTNYGIKESKLASIYIESLNLSPNSHDAYSLNNWKKPGHKVD